MIAGYDGQPLPLANPALFLINRMKLEGFIVSEHRSEEHTSELQSLMRISYAVFCLKKKKHKTNKDLTITQIKSRTQTKRYNIAATVPHTSDTRNHTTTI